MEMQEGQIEPNPARRRAVRNRNKKRRREGRGAKRRDPVRGNAWPGQPPPFISQSVYPLGKRRPSSRGIFAGDGGGRLWMALLLFRPTAGQKGPRTGIWRGWKSTGTMQRLRRSGDGISRALGA